MLPPGLWRGDCAGAASGAATRAYRPRRRIMAGCPKNGLCPMRLTSVVNGVYYYDCLSCLNGVSHGSVGGHDTRAHTTGVNCTCILDAIAFARARMHVPIQEGASGDVEVVCLSSETEEHKGIIKGITFNNSKFPNQPDLAFASTLALKVQVDHLTSDKWRVDYQLDSSKIAARLLTIRATWDDVTTNRPITKILRVGQELNDPGDTGYDVKVSVASAPVKIGSFHHKITLNNRGNDVHYILLKTKT
jgi:hypothetical protein